MFGPDLEVINQINDQLERTLRTVPNTRSVYAERELGGYFIDVTPDREAIARYGLSVAEVLDVGDETYETGSHATHRSQFGCIPTSFISDTGAVGSSNPAVRSTATSCEAGVRSVSNRSQPRSGLMPCAYRT